MKRSPATLACLFGFLMIGYQVEVTLAEKSSKSESKKSEDYHTYSMEMSTKPAMKSRHSKGKDIFVNDGKGKGTKSSSSSMSSSRSHYSAMMNSGKGGKGIGSSAKSPKASKSAKVSKSPKASGPPVPTVSPTFTNETLPPGATRTPTSSPTASPTLAPSLGPFPCEPDQNGDYGIVDGSVGEEQPPIEFFYALETLPETTDAQVDQIIADLEADIARSIVERLIPECAPDNRRLSESDFAQVVSLPSVNHHRRLQDEILVGLSPKPDDFRVTDRSCERPPNRCDLVNAAVTIWTLTTRRRLQGASDVLDAIQDSLAEEDFNSGRGDDEPVILGTDYVPDDELPPRNIPPLEGDSDDGLDTVWIIVIAAGGGVVLLLAMTAFFLLRSDSVDNEETRQLPKQDGSDSEYSDSGRRRY